MSPSATRHRLHASAQGSSYARCQARPIGSCRHLLTRWSVGAGDSLHVTFHNGFSGTEFVLAPGSKGDTLRGRAQEHWYSGPPFDTDAGVSTAVRIACPDTGNGGRRGPDA